MVHIPYVAKDPPLDEYKDLDRDLIWCYTHSAVVRFHAPVGGKYLSTLLTLPDGSMFTGYGFNNVVAMARKGEWEKERAKAIKEIEATRARKENEIKVNIKMNGTEDLLEKLKRIQEKVRMSSEVFIAENDFDRLLLTLKRQHDMEVKK